MERGLIIKKQHLDKIYDDGKIWEMRSSPTNIRGRIGLIESGSGLITGECEIVDCYKYIAEQARQRLFDWLEWMHCHQVSDLDKLNKWRYPWVLKGAKRYAEPIPYKHPKGAVIWVKLDSLHK